jgi:hypothetical protein
MRGRQSGKLRSTPITPMVIDGKHYVVEGFPGADWVKKAGLVKDGRPEEFEALAGRCAVFRFDPV